MVEDQDELRHVIRDIMTRYGYQILVARDADEALRIAETDQDIDAALLDIVLPGGTDGGQLAKALRKSRPDLRIIFCKGYAAEDVFSQLDDFEHDGLYNKPLNISNVAEKLDAVFGMDGDAPAPKKAKRTLPVTLSITAKAKAMPSTRAKTATTL